MSGNQTFTALAAEKVRSMCSYISSDAFIANYIGIKVSEVARIRANIPKTRGRPIGQGPVNPADLNAFGEVAWDPRAQRLDAELGSKALLKALVLYARNHHPQSDLAGLDI